MPLVVFQAPQPHLDAQSALRELVGQQLRSVFVADPDEPLTGHLVECLRRMEERESGQAASGDEPPATSGGAK